MKNKFFTLFTVSAEKKQKKINKKNREFIFSLECENVWWKIRKMKLTKKSNRKISLVSFFLQAKQDFFSFNFILTCFSVFFC